MRQPQLKVRRTRQAGGSWLFGCISNGMQVLSWSLLVLVPVIAWGTFGGASNHSSLGQNGDGRAANPPVGYLWRPIIALGVHVNYKRTCSGNRVRVDANGWTPCCILHAETLPAYVFSDCRQRKLLELSSSHHGLTAFISPVGCSAGWALRSAVSWIGEPPL